MQAPTLNEEWSRRFDRRPGRTARTQPSVLQWLNPFLHYTQLLRACIVKYLTDGEEYAAATLPGLDRSLHDSTSVNNSSFLNCVRGQRFTLDFASPYSLYVTPKASVGYPVAF